jgi:miniconductance mechanosensitive channel
MVSPGDWIEMPKYGVDGDIMEIGLTTVKVRNFDKTITTVPTQALIADSFKNWRGMQETGGRRIKRSVYINVNSIRFCTEKDLKRFASIQYISEYIEKKHKEITQHNKAQKVNLENLANGRRMTNIGTFRNYIEAYLINHPDIHKNLTILVRQLKPTENGLPIEIYAFTNDTNWNKYESIQADIFDHILAVAAEFDLTVFQNPSGADFGRVIAKS